MTEAAIARSRWLAVLLLAVVVSRIPFLLTCYSTDPDGWRVAHAGRIFWETGVYSVSRFPGYPVYEIVGGLAALAGGAFLSNATTLAVSLVLIIIWYGFVEEHTSSPRLLTLLLAFTPLFWIQSAATMDYVWSLLFILLAFSAAQQQRAVLAGLWLGIAIGCRPPNGVAVVPVFMLLSLQSPSKRTLAVFALALCGSALIAFSPVLVTYGPVGWIRQTLDQTSDAHLTLVQRIPSFLYRSTYSLGPLAALALGTVLYLERRKVLALYRTRDPIIIGSLAGVLSFAVLFAMFPLDKSYLIPAFPFLFLVVERVVSRRALVAVAWCVVSFGFINPDMIRHAKPVGTPELNLHTGLVIEEWTMRTRLVNERETIGKLPIKGKAVIMLGISELYLLENSAVVPDTVNHWADPNDYTAHSVSNPDIYFVSSLRLATIRTLQGEGYGLYYLDWARGLLQRWNGYDPVEEGVTPITL